MEATTVYIPLFEAVIEARFKGDARISSWRGEFQQRIRDEYSELFVPRVNEGDAPALMHYQFTNPSATRMVNVAINSLVLICKEYPGWNAFKTEFLSYWQQLARDLSMKHMTRLGMRYQNRFDQQTWPALSQHFNKKPYLQAIMPNTKTYVVDLVLEHDGFGLRCQARYSQKPRELLVDYDAFIDNPNLDNLEESLEKLHQVIEREFVDLITPDFAQSVGIETR